MPSLPPRRRKKRNASTESGSQRKKRSEKSNKAGAGDGLSFGIYAGIVGGVFVVVIVGMIGWRFFGHRSEQQQVLQDAQNEVSSSFEDAMKNMSEDIDREFAKAANEGGKQADDRDGKVPRGDFDPSQEFQWKNEERRLKSERQLKDILAILDAPTVKNWVGKPNPPTFSRYSSTMGDRSHYKLTFRNKDGDVAEVNVRLNERQIISAMLSPRGQQSVNIPTGEIKLPQ